jgi:CRISPR-associated protein Cmr3
MLVDCHFNIIDSWFFRESRGLDAIGAGASSSLFPPPVSTLAGALRTSIGDQLGVNWQAFAQQKSLPEHHHLLGTGSNLGALTLCGPFLQECEPGTSKVSMLYPAPAGLFSATTIEKGQSQTTLHRISIGASVQCDMGYLALPQLKPTSPAGSKPLQNTWITADGLQQWLSGKIPEASALRSLDDLICQDSRLGIGRNNATSTVTDGLLYQTQHVRFKTPNLAVYLQVSGMPKDVHDATEDHVVRLGGEGRQASMRVKQNVPSWQPPKAQVCPANGLVLMLTTAAQHAKDIMDQPLPGFEAVLNEAGQVTHWLGEIQGVALKLISSVMPRMVRVGGWDQQQHQAKPLTSLLAPGTIYYCTLENQGDSLADAIEAINGCQVGQGQASGYGQLVAGYWPKQDSASK